MCNCLLYTFALLLYTLALLLLLLLAMINVILSHLQRPPAEVRADAVDEPARRNIRAFLIYVCRFDLSKVFGESIKRILIKPTIFIIFHIKDNSYLQHIIYLTVQLYIFDEPGLAALRRAEDAVLGSILDVP